MAGKQILIIGGGISGLGLAVALHRQGRQVRVFEKEGGLTNDHSGLVLTANAINVLSQYQLTKHLQESGPKLSKFLFRDPAGNQLMSLPMTEHNEDHPTQAIGKATLQQRLLAALPKNTYFPNHELKTFSQNEQGVTAHFTNGETAEGELLVGADGLHSKVCKQLFGDLKPQYAGYVQWHGTTSSDLVTPGTLFESSGAGHRFGATNIGGGQVYWYACINVAPHTHFGRRTQEELVLRFLRFHSPVAAIIESTSPDEIITRPCYYRDPIPSWSKDRVSLLGNAAHPMASELGQSTCQGLEDGLVLANCLLSSNHIPTALKHYELHRAPRTARAQRTSKIAGKLGQVQHPLACTLRNLAMRYTPQLSVQRHYHQMLGLDTKTPLPA